LHCLGRLKIRHLANPRYEIGMRNLASKGCKIL
jgi:hypothetical protein